MNLELNKQDILDWTKTRWHIYTETVLPNPARTLRFKVSSDQKYLVEIDGEEVYMGYDFDMAIDYYNMPTKLKETFEIQYKQHHVVTVKISAENYEAAEQELKDWLKGESVECPFFSSKIEDGYYEVSGEVIV